MLIIRDVMIPLKGNLPIVMEAGPSLTFLTRFYVTFQDSVIESTVNLTSTSKVHHYRLGMRVAQLQE